MDTRHRLLARQLKKRGAAPSGAADEAFLRAIDAAYRQADDERQLLERSLELTSQEMLRDLDELRRAKAALSQSRAFLEKAQEVANLGSWVAPISGGGELIWSKECFRIFGLDENSSLSFAGYLQLVHPDDRERVQHAREAAISGAQPYTIDYRIRRADGAMRWVHVRADVIRDPAGAPLKLIGIIQDITEHRELEDRLRQSQKMEAVGRLAGGIAHDFNNILTAIKGYSAFLKLTVDENGEAFQDVEEIEKAADRAAALTYQLLAFSRKQVLKPEVLDVNAVVAGLESMMRCLIREDIKLVTRLRPGLGRIKADPGQISQVIMNLIVNGRDAMPNGGTLIIETGEAAGTVRLTVTDDGAGMEPAVLARVFEPFFTTKEQGKGTGLGLSTVYGIVQQSGGHIEAVSVPGKGSQFTIHLPRFDELVEIKASGSVLGPTRAQGNETVLLVEDESGVRAMISRALRQQGYEVLAAADGHEALRLFQAYPKPIDAIVTDIIMPGMNGRVLAERLGALKPGLRVLYMSGYTDDVIAHHGVLEPGTPFLQKPFSPRALGIKLREVLSA